MSKEEKIDHPLHPQNGIDETSKTILNLKHLQRQIMLMESNLLLKLNGVSEQEQKAVDDELKGVQKRLSDVNRNIQYWENNMVQSDKTGVDIRNQNNNGCSFNMYHGNTIHNLTMTTNNNANENGVSLASPTTCMTTMTTSSTTTSTVPAPNTSTATAITTITTTATATTTNSVTTTTTTSTTTSTTTLTTSTAVPTLAPIISTANAITTSTTASTTVTVTTATTPSKKRKLVSDWFPKAEKATETPDECKAKQDERDAIQKELQEKQNKIMETFTMKAKELGTCHVSPSSMS
jgi:hypothetical protein